MRRTTIHQLLLGSALFFILAVSGYLIFVHTTWGQAFDYDAYFSYEDVGRGVRRFIWALFSVVKIPTLIVIALALVTIGFVRRRWLVGVLAAAGLAMTVGGAVYLKHELPRPELVVPAGRVPKSFHKDTYPSGHTSFAMGIAMAFLLVAPVRWRPWGSVVGGMFGAAYAAGVVMYGGHRPSDPMGAIFWSALCLSVAAAVYLYFSPRRDCRPNRPDFLILSTSAFIALSMVVLTWLSIGWSALDLSGLPFLVSMLIIVFTAFATTVWFGWVLSGEDEVESASVPKTQAEFSLP